MHQLSGFCKTPIVRSVFSLQLANEGLAYTSLFKPANNRLGCWWWILYSAWYLELSHLFVWAISRVRCTLEEVSWRCLSSSIRRRYSQCRVDKFLFTHQYVPHHLSNWIGYCCRPASRLEAIPIHAYFKVVGFQAVFQYRVASYARVRSVEGTIPMVLLTLVLMCSRCSTQHSVCSKNF